GPVRGPRRLEPIMDGCTAIRRSVETKMLSTGLGLDDRSYPDKNFAQCFPGVYDQKQCVSKALHYSPAETLHCATFTLYNGQFARRETPVSAGRTGLPCRDRDTLSQLLFIRGSSPNPKPRGGGASNATAAPSRVASSGTRATPSSSTSAASTSPPPSRSR